MTGNLPLGAPTVKAKASNSVDDEEGDDEDRRGYFCMSPSQMSSCATSQQRTVEV